MANFLAATFVLSESKYTSLINFFGAVLKRWISKPSNQQGGEKDTSPESNKVQIRSFGIQKDELAAVIQFYYFVIRLYINPPFFQHAHKVI